MQLRYISDIHLEHMNSMYQVNKFIQTFQPNPTIQDEVCILAGDIGNPYSKSYETFLQHCASSFQKTFLVAGNHEFYAHGHSIPDTLKQIQAVVSKYPTITFLHNASEDYQGIRFIGTILWSKITNPAYTINDTKYIKGMTIETYQTLHQQDLQFLTDTLATTTEPTIVITHHMPSYSLIHPNYITPHMQPYNQWFATDLDALIKTYQSRIQGWFYGHTHMPSQTTLHGVSMLCNPKGYPHESSPSQTPVRTFHVPDQTPLKISQASV